MLLRARIVLPVSQPPIENGIVEIAGNRLISVGRCSAVTTDGEVADLGDVILLPGLVNAHCHLDYTDMAGKIPQARSFTDWIKSMVALKAEWSYTDFAQSWLRGATMLLRTGTTTVVDIEAAPELMPEMWDATPLRVISLRELINIRNRSAVGEMVDTAVRQWSALPDAASRAGLSPHAPYTTSTELLQRAGEAARQAGWPLATHVAESEQEFEMFVHRRGPLFDWLKVQRDTSDCGMISPVGHLERAGYLQKNLLAIHVNYLGPGDAVRLGRNGVSVVHCPCSHNYFRHRDFPRAELASAGVNLCLGTDSLVSVLKLRGLPLELNMFAEMRTFAAAAPGVPPAVILRMATVNGAQALRRKGELGELSPNALADMIAIPFSGKIGEAEAAVVHHTGDVVVSIIDGRQVFARETISQ